MRRHSSRAAPPGSPGGIRYQRLVPSARVRIPAAAIGAVVTTALFTLVRWGFGIYADYLMSGRLNFIYGAVGLAIIFLMLWCLLISFIILVGAEMNSLLEEKRPEEQEES